MTSQSILPLLIHYCDSNNHVNIYKSSWGIKIPTMLESSSCEGLQLKEQLLHFQAQKCFRRK